MFKDILQQTEKTFPFRIKALFELNDDMMVEIEKVLRKYRPTSIGAPKKTMFQKNPLGFTGAVCKEVWLVDIELSVPTTSLLLEYDLRTALGYERFDETLRVVSDADPREGEEDGTEECQGEEETEKVSLLAQESYEECEEAKFEDYYGDNYNENFMKRLAEVELARKEKARAGEVDALNPITKWSDQPKLGTDLTPGEGNDK